MIQKESLLIGYDLGNEYSQISCYNNQTFEPDTISLIPTLLAVKNNSEDWCYGEEALELSKKGEGILIENIIHTMESKEEINVLGTAIGAASVLFVFLKESLSILKERYPNESIKMITFTLKKMNPLLRKNLQRALTGLGFKEDRVVIQTYDQSYLYYALSQKKELWMNDVGLFEFNETGLFYSQISINRKVRPMLVGITKRDFSSDLNYEILQKDKDSIPYLFQNIANSVIHKQFISTLYMIGKGFEGTWSDCVLAQLCVGRRVFKGQNLYTRGACYASRELSGESKLSDFLFFTEEMITSDITMKVYKDTVISEITLAKSGVPWYEVNYNLDVILDEEEEIEIIIKHIMKRNPISQIIVLDGLPKRPNKTTRVSIKAEFLDIDTCVITIKDKGFGEFYTTTNRIWEKIIKV